jgi:hypothetical protein
MLAQLRDWHQTLSYKLGYGRGLEGRVFTVPWWVDGIVYALAYADGTKERQQRAAAKKEGASL